ncbi:MAG: integral rane sensor signal transduction histidine kinase [Pseudonocardiales bacterium]|nr:integral rane sensor signal transduction histidine kinase [Pseudonocardiales bacterium]
MGLTVLAAVLATALFGIPLAAAAARYFIADEHNELVRTADTVAVAVSGDLARAQKLPALARPEPGTQVGIYDPGGRLVGGAGPTKAAALLARASGGTTASGQINGRYAVAVPVSDGDTIAGVVLVTAGHAQVNRRIGAAWLAMAGLAAVAVAASWLVARRQARRLTNPLERLSLAAERLGAGDFTVRSEASGIAEIDSVNSSLDRTADRLAALIERERAFTADASHQLRTPLTGLRLGLETALDDPAADPRPAMRDALAAADRLHTTVTDLLALARDTPRSNVALDVDALVAEVHDRWNGILAAHGRPLRIAVHAPVPVSDLSHACAQQILDVLVDNAYQHGQGTVTVTVRDAEDALAIDVSDEGPPITRDVRSMFVRRSADATGTGIGLALARSLAESEGGRLNLTAASPTTFTLLVPARAAT